MATVIDDVLRAYVTYQQFVLQVLNTQYCCVLLRDTFKELTTSLSLLVLDYQWQAILLHFDFGS